MEKIDILYDHYKESNSLNKEAQQDRGKYLKYLCLFIFINFIFLLYPNEVTNIINQILDKQYSATTTITYIIFQASLWALITYTLIQYLHKNIYIERQYLYLRTIEKEIGKIIGNNVFNREGDNYLENYPLILDILDMFYKWILPMLIIAVNGCKIYFEFVNNVCLFLKIFDSICFCFILLLIVLYLKMLHFNNEAKKNNKIRIDINISIDKSTNA